ncbi:MAG: hypothetical protein RL071_2225, partial [Pseudomonadota bacterium]
GAVVLVSSALQLLGEGERARLSAAAAAARAPLALVVLRMDACEDEADVADLEGRARSFAAALGCPALLLDGADDAAAEDALRALLAAAAPGAPARLRQALAARIDDALSCLPAPGTAELAAAEAALDEADSRARSAARGQLEAAGAAMRGAWPARLRAMDAEARSHEAPSALERELRALWVEASRRHLRLLLEAAAPERSAEAEGAAAVPTLGPAPALHEARRPRSPGLLAAAALTTVGVLLLPGASPAVAAAGLSLVAGSLLSARVVRLRHDGARGRLQEQAVIAWIDAGITACAAALDEQAGRWRAQLRAALRDLHAAGGDPATETLRAGLRRLREALRAEGGESAGDDAAGGDLGDGAAAGAAGSAGEGASSGDADPGADLAVGAVAADGEAAGAAGSGGGVTPSGDADPGADLGGVASAAGEAAEGAAGLPPVAGSGGEVTPSGDADPGVDLDDGAVAAGAAAEGEGAAGAPPAAGEGAGAGQGAAEAAPDGASAEVPPDPDGAEGPEVEVELLTGPVEAAPRAEDDDEDADIVEAALVDPGPVDRAPGGRGGRA